MVVGKLQGHKEEALKKKERKLEEKQTRKMRVGNSTLGLKSSFFPRNFQVRRENLRLLNLKLK